MDHIVEKPTTLMELAMSIPDVVWAAVIAAGITLLGVFLQNISSRRQVKAQLKHDAIQRDRERQMNIRQDVFVDTLRSKVAIKLLG